MFSIEEESILEEVLQDKETYLDAISRELLYNIPSKDDGMDKVRQWALQVAGSRMTQASLDPAKIVWRGADPYNFVPRDRDVSIVDACPGAPFLTIRLRCPSLCVSSCLPMSPGWFVLEKPSTVSSQNGKSRQNRNARSSSGSSGRGSSINKMISRNEQPGQPSEGPSEDECCLSCLLTDISKS